MIGGSGSDEGRLAQEDVEELKQRWQDHGPQRQLTALGVRVRAAPQLSVAVRTHAETSRCGVRMMMMSQCRGCPEGLVWHRLSLIPGDTVRLYMKEGRTLFPCFLILLVLLLPCRLHLPWVSKQGVAVVRSPLNIQLFNSFHPSATETQSAFCLCSACSLHGSDESSAGPRFLIKPRPVSPFFSPYNISMSFFGCLPPHRALADGCLAVNSSESQSKSACRRRRKEGRKKRWKTATGESVLTNCRWSSDAIQLLLVILLLLLLRKESGRERGRENCRRRERDRDRWRERERMREKKLVRGSVSV